MSIFRKIEVNGAREHPLFTYLKVSSSVFKKYFERSVLKTHGKLQKSCPSTRDFFAPAVKLDYSPLRINDIRWNFEKFLVNRSGRPVKRYDAAARVMDMRADIEMLIASPQ